MFLMLLCLAFNYSPSDSCQALISIHRIPERAILFARLAARDGGGSSVELGRLLELSGDFRGAESVYSIAAGSAADDEMRRWLNTRSMGCRTLDTLLILSVRLSNPWDSEVTDIDVSVPLPVSHPPYQSLRYTAGMFRPEGPHLKATVDRIPPRTEIVLPIVLELRQEPVSFRPLPETLRGSGGSITIRGMADLMNAISLPRDPSVPGPCLPAALALAEKVREAGLELSVTGGVVRVTEDSLQFHAWNILADPPIPMDVTLFQQDSLGGIGHCPSDIIPLWDLEAAGGNEVSVYYSSSQPAIDVSMEAALGDPELLNNVLDIYTLPLLRRNYP